MNEIIDRLVRYLVYCSKVYDSQADELLHLDNPKGIRSNPRLGHTAYELLCLYLTEHKDNPYYQSSRALEIFQRAIRAWCSLWQEQIDAKGTFDAEEWRPFILCRGLALVGRKFSPELRSQAEKILANNVESEIVRPFFFTAPNHEMWNMLVAWSAGKTLDRPEWCEQALFEARQLMRYQTPEGFWEEGRHHGPSMSYCSVMLSPLAVLARESGDPVLQEAAVKQAKFMVDWCFPDGTTVGAIDGRTMTRPGFMGPGLELVPEGITLLSRMYKTWDDAGWLDPEKTDTPLYGMAIRGNFMGAEALRYFSEGLASEESAPLIMDRDGAVLENHTAYHDATMFRKGPWAVALSSQLSDVPKDTQFIYRRERQNRIDLWHEKGGVIIGGGHSLVTAKYPLYNVWVEPGYHVEPGHYSKTNDDAGSPEMARRRSKYYPRWAASGVDNDKPWLELVFAHATIRFSLELLPSEVNIRYEYDATNIEELKLCLPMMIWNPGKAAADGGELEDSGEPGKVVVKDCVSAASSLYGSEVTLSVPKTGETTFLYPLEPAQAYLREHLERMPKGFYTMGLLETVIRECQVSGGKCSGEGEWRLRMVNG